MPLPSGIDALLGEDFLNAHRAKIQYNKDSPPSVSFNTHDTKSSFHNISTTLLTDPIVVSLDDFESDIHVSSHLPPVVGPANQPEATHYLSDNTTIDEYSAESFMLYLKQHPDEPVFTLLVPHGPSTVSGSPHTFQNHIDSINSEFSDVFAPPSGIPMRDGGIVFEIPLQPGATLPKPRHYDIPHHQQLALDEWLTKAKSRGWIEQCESPVNIPIFLVPKTGGWRTVLDFRRINNITQNVHQADIPRAQRLLEKLQPANLLSKMDLHDGFYQLALEPSARYLTAFTVRGAQYHFLVSPQGLMNVPLYFQREVTRILRKHNLYDNLRIQHVLCFIPQGLRHLYDKLAPDTIVGTSNVYIDDILLGTNLLTSSGEHD
jgi:hypothetical protein